MKLVPKILHTTFAFILACGPQVQDEQPSSLSGFDDSEFDASKYRAIQNEAQFKDDFRLKDRTKPVLFFYAVDTEEPFMQAAVDYEIRSLRSACRKQDSVNFVTFVNSHIVWRKGKFLLCQDGQLFHRRLDKKTMAMIDVFSQENYDPLNPEQFGLKIKLTHKKEFNKLFANYPLAHPDMLLALLEYTNDVLFKDESISIFAHLKSHGSDEILLSGLTEEQLARKVDRQKDVLGDYMKKIRDNALHSDRSLDFRNRVACESVGGSWTGRACKCEKTGIFINQFFGKCSHRIGDAGFGSVKLGDLGLDTIGLGRSRWAQKGMMIGEPGMGEPGMGEPGMGEPGMGEPGMGEPGMGEPGMGEPGMGEPGMGEPGMGEPGMGEPGMGEPGMGEPGMGFDDVGTDGLGIVGMGADIHFGTTHTAMAQVLDELEQHPGIKIGFLIFESCESKVASHKLLKSTLAESSVVDGYYSAEGSLWYRNFGWDLLLKRTTEHGTFSLQRRLKHWVKVVPSYVKIESAKEREKSSD